MKKWLFIAGGSIVGSIFLIVQLYRNTDIEFIDQIVENAVKVLPFKPAMVEAKQIRKAEEQQAIAIAEKENLAEVVATEPKPDSVVVAPIEDEKPTFNTIGLKESGPKVVAIDSGGFYGAAVVEEPKVEEEENPFNSVSIAPVRAANDEGFLPTTFFGAQVHNTQPVKNEQLIWLRTAEEFEIDGEPIPKFTQFQAKVNIFDGRIVLHVTKIGKVALKGTNYEDERKGLLIAARHKQNGGYVLSNGEAIQFGY